MAQSARSLTTVRHTRLRVAAVLYFGARLLLAVVLIAAPIAYFGFGWMDWRVAAGAAGAFGLVFLMAFLAARPLRCGACGQPSLRHSGKAKHAYAGKWLGLSCRAKVAWDVMTAQDHFCMYCHSRIRHQSKAGKGESLKFQPSALRPGLSAPGALPAMGQATIFDAALLAAEPDKIFGSAAPVTAAVPSPGASGEASPPPAPAGPVPHPSTPVPVQPLPAMTSPAPFPSIPETSAPVLPLPFPAAAPMAVSPPLGPPTLPVLTAPVLPTVASVPPPAAEVPMAVPSPFMPPAMVGAVGDNPFVKQSVVLPEAPVPALPASVAPEASSPPPLPVPVQREPSSFFGPVRPPAAQTVPSLPEVTEPAKEKGPGPAALPGRSAPVALPSVQGVLTPASLPAVPAEWPEAIAAEPVPVPAEVLLPAAVAGITSPVSPPAATVPAGLPPSMEAVIAALQQGQETLGAAFQTVITQLRAVMDQMAVAPSSPVPVPVAAATLVSPALTAPVPAAPVPPAQEVTPSMPFPPPPEWPALPAAGPAEIPTRPTPLPTSPVPAVAAPPVAPLSAPPVSPWSPPVTVSPGFRVYPPLHPVVPAVSPPLPHALTAPVSLPVPVVPVAEAVLPSSGVNLATAPAVPPVPMAGWTQETPVPGRRRPLPNLPKTVFEELGPTLAQAFAPAGALDLLEAPGTHPPALPPVPPLAPAPFPALPVLPPAPAESHGTTGVVPPTALEPAPPIGISPAGSFALPSLEVPPGNSFMPAPPPAGTNPLPPALPEADSEHPAVPAPFSFLQAVQPPTWPADDLPALPLSEETPMWTRTRGKTSLS